MVRNIVGLLLALFAATVWTVVAVRIGVEDSLMRTMISCALAATIFCAFFFSGNKPDEPEAPAAT
ncbi:hypothetical protein HMPREF0291_11761 [Corynebacterium genitalium ATCC 33030]|uniref:Uncharacterized protein n=1 Tax=Corynebacterium genitalium ATCC 33030 TaxID=585529 RepID=D7WD73_9CORY|nr:hypothetical protein HMPREF0291_11761 [Corynebacterium genitalium ATCC 33030]